MVGFFCFNFYKIIFQVFEEPVLLLQLPVVPVSLELPQGADTTLIFSKFYLENCCRGHFCLKYCYITVILL